MSEQAINSDSTNWAIIKQLLNEGAGSVLDNRQRIDLAAPQPIDSAAFSPPPAEMPAVAPHLPVHSYVAAAPLANDKIGASLLDSISASLQAGPPEVATAQPVAAATPVGDAAPLRARLPWLALPCSNSCQPARRLNRSCKAPRPLWLRRLSPLRPRPPHSPLWRLRPRLTRASNSCLVRLRPLLLRRCRRMCCYNPCWRKLPHAVSLRLLP